MPDRRKPPRRPLSFLDAQDRVVKLTNIYRTEVFGADRTKTLASQAHQDLNDIATPEPDEELEGAELSDAERNSAIARERMRREGYL